MIQRVQSIWLLLAGLTIFLLLVVPVLSNQSNEFLIRATGLFQETNGIAKKVESFTPLYISVIAVGILCLASIFSFRNRTVQKRLASVSIVLIIALSFWIFNYSQKIPGGIASANFGAGAFLPVFAILFCALGIRGIRKDEQLLRSADRLR